MAISAAALAVALGCLGNEQRYGVRLSSCRLSPLFAPLLVPQVSFLFGAQALTTGLGIGGSWPAPAWSHMLFFLPYLFLSLAGPYRALDHRYARAALCLGASPARVSWPVKLPTLLRPTLFPLAIGLAVSVSFYLPTLPVTHDPTDATAAGGTVIAPEAADPDGPSPSSTVRAALPPTTRKEGCSIPRRGSPNSARRPRPVDLWTTLTRCPQIHRPNISSSGQMMCYKARTSSRANDRSAIPERLRQRPTPEVLQTPPFAFRLPRYAEGCYPSPRFRCY